MEPAASGSGLVFDSICSEDVLDRNWQRLILHICQKKLTEEYLWERRLRI